MKYCGKCGVKLDVDTNLCPKCKKLKSTKQDRKFNKRYIIIPVVVMLIMAIAFTGLNLFGVIGFPFSNNQKGTKSNDDFGRIEFKEFTVNDVVFENNELFVKNQLLITADKKHSYSDIEDAVKKHGGKIVGCIEFTNDYQVEFDDLKYTKAISTINSLTETLPNSEVVLHNVYHVDTDETVNSQDYSTEEGNWWRKAISLTDLEKENLVFQKVKVGVYDTLFETKNKDISYAIDPDNIWYNNEKQVYVADSGEHGTNVCGFLASKKNNQYGIDGVANNTEILGYAYRGKTNSFNSAYSSIMEDKYWFAKMITNGVKVINMSAGKDELHAASQQNIDKAVTHLKLQSTQLGAYYRKFIDSGYEFVIVKSAGNVNGYTWIECEQSKNHPYGIKSFEPKIDGKLSDCKQLKNILYTADYDLLGAISDYKVKNRIIIVGSSNKENKRAKHSVRGQRVDIYAPGESVTELTTGKNGVGTSYATPMVAGVVALMWGVNPNLSADHISYLLTSHTTQFINGEDYKYIGVGGEEEIEYKYLLDAKTSVMMASSFISGKKESTPGKSYVMGSVRIMNKKSIEYFEGKCKIFVYMGDGQNPIDGEFGELIKEETTDNNGDFFFELEPGFYYISAESDNGTYATNNKYAFWINESDVTYINGIYLISSQSINNGFVNDKYLVEYNEVLYGVDKYGLWKNEGGNTKDYLVNCSASNIATDGQTIYYSVRNENSGDSQYQYDMHKYDLNTKKDEKITSYVECGVPILAEGETIYYTDFSENYKSQTLAHSLCSYNTSTGEKKYIHDGAQLVKSCDGKIFYRDVLGTVPSANSKQKWGQIFCYDTTSKKTEMISDGGVMNFKVISGKLYYSILYSDQSNTIKVCRYDISSGKTKVLFEKVGKDLEIQDYDERYAIYTSGYSDSTTFYRVSLSSGKEEKISSSSMDGYLPHKAIRDKNRTVLYTDYSGGNVYTINDSGTKIDSSTGNYKWDTLLAIHGETAFAVACENKDFTGEHSGETMFVDPAGSSESNSYYEYYICCGRVS